MISDNPTLPIVGVLSGVHEMYTISDFHGMPFWNFVILPQTKDI